MRHSRIHLVRRSHRRPSEGSFTTKPPKISKAPLHPPEPPVALRHSDAGIADSPSRIPLQNILQPAGLPHRSPPRPGECLPVEHRLGEKHPTGGAREGGRKVLSAQLGFGHFYIRRSGLLSRRDYVPKPRVAKLPWEQMKRRANPNGVVSRETSPSKRRV